MSPRITCPTTLEERENHILQVTADLIEEVGAGSLTVDKVVARVPYSKGTVYNHFSCKEDLLVALCTHKLANLKELFIRAAAFNGKPRDRVVALHAAYFLYALQSPAQAMAILYTKTPNLEEKVSPGRLDKLFECDAELLGIGIAVLEEARTKGDLSLPSHISMQQMAFSSWAAAFGTIALMSSMIEPCPVVSGLILDKEFFSNVNVVLDGHGLKPLSHEHNTQASLMRILETVFAPEVEELRQKGRPLFI